MTEAELDRRPLKSRNWAVSGKIAAWLANRGASPNGISVAGMVCGVLAGVAFALTGYAYTHWDTGAVRGLWLAAALFMQCRLLANLFDGMVAVEQGKASAVGELYNEVPDRISDVAIMIGAGYALGGWIAGGFLAAVASMFTAYVRAMGKAATGKNDFRGPMAKQQRMALLTAFCLVALVLPSGWWTQPLICSFTLLGLVLLVIVVGALFTSCRRLVGIARDLNRTGGAL